MHVRVVDALSAKPAKQWYVAVVGLPELYANDVDEYTIYARSGTTKPRHCAGVHVGSTLLHPLCAQPSVAAPISTKPSIHAKVAIEPWR